MILSSDVELCCFFLPELLWLSAVAGTHSKGLAGVFKRCVINPCLLKIKEVCLEVGTIVNAYNHIFSGSAGGIVLLAVAASSVLGACTLLPELAVKELLEKWKKGSGRE